MRTFANAEDGNIVSVVVDGDRAKKLNRGHLESVFFALLGGNTYSNHRYSSLLSTVSLLIFRHSDKSLKLNEGDDGYGCEPHGWK